MYATRSELGGTKSRSLPSGYRRLAVGILALHVGLLAWGGYRNSPVDNEPAHLAAGLRHWLSGRFELYRVNPPLVRAIAALPVLAAGCRTDWSSVYEGPGGRPEFDVGIDFMAANGDRSFWLISLARWACIPFSVLGACVALRWARELFGPGSGLLALALWCFCPNILANSQLITPDAGTASLGLTASYVFWRWLRDPGWVGALVAGCALGLALLAKSTWVILPGIWGFMWVALRVTGWTPGGHRPGLARVMTESAQLLTCLAISALIINMGYGFEGSFQRLGAYQFVSRSLAGANDNPTASGPAQGNRFAGRWLGGIVVPFPSSYVEGIDIQKRDFENYPYNSYLNGKFSAKGWWYYYLYGMTIKVPLGTWGLLLAACVGRLRTLRDVCWADEFVLITPAVITLAFISCQTGFSHHFRYALPFLPFAFVWISQAARLISRTKVPAACLVVFAATWSITSSLWTYPHSLSYFNELAGGPFGGHRFMIHSSIDWGQDLNYLREWAARHKEARPLYLAYFGGFPPKSVGLSFALPPAPSAGKGFSTDGLAPGWYAVSVNILKGAHWAEPRLNLKALQRLRPVASAGYSIYIYRVVAPPPKAPSG